MGIADSVLKLLGFGAEPKQPSLMNCEDNHIRKKSIAVRGNRLAQDKERKSWFRLRKLYTEIKGLCGSQLMILDEYDALPLNPYPLYSGEELNRLTQKDLVVEEALKEGVAKVDFENHKLFAFNILGLSIAFAVFVALGIVGLWALKSNFDFGSLLRGIGGRSG